ncbi:MAG TPA: MFS transporter [Candidatus Dormibacteraeota bacterium]|nr:MFS transporter [Candidatus Dormibacteraeota bacterium]
MHRRGGASAGAAYACFAVFGGYWGAWAASIPALREQAGVTDGQLGTALLFVGAGALPAMLLTGRLVDRWGRRAAGALLALLGAVGVLVVVTGRDLTSLSAGVAAMGAASGAADVAINTVAGSAQQASGRSVIARAHATFSFAVVAGSLGAGALRALGAPLVTAFALVAVAAAGLAVAVAAGVAGADGAPHTLAGRVGAAWRRPPVATGPLLILGTLGALAFVVENGHESWSALYLQDVLNAGPATAAAGPAVFASVMAITRLGAGRLSTRRPGAVLLTGSVTAAIGTMLVAAAPSVPAGLLGLGTAAAGTAVLFPTVLGVLSARVPEHVRGTATSIVTTVAYLGFLAGPVYVGRWADIAGLRGAMIALAALAAGLAPVAAVSLRRLGAQSEPPGRAAASRRRM